MFLQISVILFMRGVSGSGSRGCGYGSGSIHPLDIPPWTHTHPGHTPEAHTPGTHTPLDTPSPGTRTPLPLGLTPLPTTVNKRAVRILLELLHDTMPLFELNCIPKFFMLQYLQCSSTSVFYQTH